MYIWETFDEKTSNILKNEIIEKNETNFSAAEIYGISISINYVT